MKSEGQLEREAEDEEDDEEDEEETVTEVEVSEKTLKFKISTEGNVTTPGGRKSYPGSRKGSREKAEYHQNVHELARAIRDGAMRDSTQSPVTTPTTPPHRPVASPSPRLSNSVPASPSDGSQLCNGETKCRQQTQAQDGAVAPSEDAPHEDAEPSRARGRERATLLSRLRTLTDKLSFNSDKHHADPDDASSASGSPSTHKAMTLPKTRRSSAGVGKRGWKSLVVGTSKGHPPSSSLELLSPTEAASPQRNKSDHIPEKSDAAALSGSLDSILKERDKSSGGNNNNRKKTNLWSSPGTRRGFLARLGRSNTHSEGTRPQQHNWMASLAASFRTKKPHHSLQE